MNEPANETTRRAFLTGRSLSDEVAQTASATGDALLNSVTPSRPLPVAAETFRLETRAMACEFSVILNPGAHGRTWVASDALDLVHGLEQQLSAYREDSELSQINRRAATESVELDGGLFDLLDTCCRLHSSTEGAFDPTSGILIRLWRECREAGRVPDQSEIDQCLAQSGMQHVQLESRARSIRFVQRGVELNFGSIGKGYALDQISESLVANGLGEFLVHGGRSSVLARGDHNQQGGWPVGIGNPLFTDKRVATLMLRDQALATSGSNIQYYRHKGRRYGHILDPRTGWPVEGTLSVSVVAPTAAMADALSTAFFVLGVEKTRACCDNLDGVGAILIPLPERGKRVQPVVIGIPEEQLFWDPEQADPAGS